MGKEKGAPTPCKNLQREPEAKAGGKRRQTRHPHPHQRGGQGHGSYVPTKSTTSSLIIFLESFQNRDMKFLEIYIVCTIVFDSPKSLAHPAFALTSLRRSDEAQIRRGGMDAPSKSTHVKTRNTNKNSLISPHTQQQQQISRKTWALFLSFLRCFLCVRWHLSLSHMLWSGFQKCSPKTKLSYFVGQVCVLVLYLHMGCL